MSDSVQPHMWQPTRLPRPWDSPGKYCKNIVLRNYIYKGYDVWKSVKKSLNNFVYQPENYRNLHQVFFDNCDYGATAFLVALMNADVQVIAKDATEFIDVARNCREVPENLRYEDYAS